jgi:serine/threonine protein phosphatase PrpC
MASFSNSIISSSAFNQLCKGQDQLHSHEYIDTETNERVNVFVDFDGHGTNHFIEAIRNSIKDGNLNILLMENKPIEAISSYFYEKKVVPYGISSGAVLSIVKIFFINNLPAKAQFHNCGDAQSLLYVNGILKYINIPHDYENPQEIEKIHAHPNFIRIIQDRGIKIISPSRMIATTPKCIVYRDGIREKFLAPTRAIGHNKVCCDESEIHEEILDPYKKYRIVIGSDGIFDMALINDISDHNILTTQNAENIVKFYSDRWLQEWFHVKSIDDSEPAGSFRFTPNEADDVSCYVIDIINFIEI